ncbi:hypothetical protein [Rubrivirga sp. IMCC43871]|uniref:hypothetical protein n=1 Tax=Rubrivirga sp. IMCC43871 TaxID=3391575 RepID=UPI0039901911
MFAFRLGLVALLLGLAPGVSAQTGESATRYPQVQDRPAADTLRYAVRAGETLIVALPARLGGTAVTYEVADAPALSWLVDRSFMWRTLARERGALPVLLRRLAPGRAPETIVLLVDITG